MHCVSELTKEELCGKRVLVRAGFDVALASGEVSGFFRIEKGLPTLTFLKDAGARVIVIYHIGRQPAETTAPGARSL